MADAILYRGTPAQTLYVRVYTSATTSVAAALTEGTGNGVGRYAVSEAALVLAGLTTSGVFLYAIFVGTPSTSANDTEVGVGTLAWDGDAEVGGPAIGPIAQYPVADEFTVVVPSRGSTNLAAATVYYVQPGEKVLMAVDFVNILHAGDAVSEITTITENTSQSITLTEIGVMGTQAKFWVENVLADTTYRIECKVLTLFGNTLEGDFTLTAAD